MGGEPLAVEALAAALGQVFAAEPEPGRVAVAMSGGVDSAVALLRAGPRAIGVTLRLWQDPAGPSAERACCSTEAVAAARATCHARGLPHVTLDLREEFRGAVVDPFTAGYAAGDTPNPCTACNGAFRFDALAGLRGTRGRGEPVDRSLRPDRRAGRAPARGPCGGSGQGSVVHALDPRPEAPRARALSARGPDQGRDPGGGRPGGPGGRDPVGEPGGVLPRRGRLPVVPRAPGAPLGERRDRRRGRQRARHPRRLLALHTGTAARARGRRRASAVRAPHRPRRERGGGGAARGARGEACRGAWTRPRPGGAGLWRSSGTAPRQSRRRS